MIDSKYSEKSLTAFLTFYVRHYQDADLEVFSQYDTDNHDTELNYFINQDRNFRMKDIVPVLLNKHTAIINSLLDDVTVNAQLDLDSMDTVDKWETWYRDQKAQLTDPDR